MQEIQRREARLETQHSDHQFEESGVNFTGDEAPSSKPDGRRAPHPEQPRTKKEEAFPRLRSPEQATDAAATGTGFGFGQRKGLDNSQHGHVGHREFRSSSAAKVSRRGRTAQLPRKPKTQIRGFRTEETRVKTLAAIPPPPPPPLSRILPDDAEVREQCPKTAFFGPLTAGIHGAASAAALRRVRIFRRKPNSWAVGLRHESNGSGSPFRGSPFEPRARARPHLSETLPLIVAVSRIMRGLVTNVTLSGFGPEPSASAFSEAYFRKFVLNINSVILGDSCQMGLTPSALSAPRVGTRIN